MMNTTLTYDEKQENKNWLVWIGRLFVPQTKTENTKVLSAEELEHLDVVRKLKEEKRNQIYPLRGLSIEDFVSRRW